MHDRCTIYFVLLITQNDKIEHPKRHRSNANKSVCQTVLYLDQHLFITLSWFQCILPINAIIVVLLIIVDHVPTATIKSLLLLHCI